MAVSRLSSSGVVEAERIVPVDDVSVGRLSHPPSHGGVLVQAAGARTIDGHPVTAGTSILPIDPALAMQPPVAGLPSPLTVGGALLTSSGAVLVGTYDAEVTHPWGETWRAPADEQGFVISLDSSGGHRWSRNDALYSFVQSDERGGTTLGGSFEGRLDVGLGTWGASGACDGFVVTFDDASGVALDGRSFSGSECETVQGLDVDRFGGVVLGGNFTGAITLERSRFVATGSADAWLLRIAD